MVSKDHCFTMGYHRPMQLLHQSDLAADCKKITLLNFHAFQGVLSA